MELFLLLWQHQKANKQHDFITPHLTGKIGDKPGPANLLSR